MKIFITKNKIITPVLWCILWQAAYLLLNREILLVSPFDVLQNIYGKLFEKEFWLILCHSIAKITTGYILAVLLGIWMAFSTYFIKFLDDFFKPMLSVIKSTPVVSFIILALIMMKAKNVPVFISFLIVLPVVWTNISEGLAQTDKKILEMAYIFRLGSYKTIKNIYWPSVFPYLRSACQTGAGMAFKAGVSAEAIGGLNLTIGGQLLNAKLYLETADLYAWTVIVIVISVLFEKVFIFFTKRCLDEN